MSVKQVADMLALAYEGFEKAKTSNDKELHQLSKKLMIKALCNKSAGEFFGGIQLALGEIQESPFGNDPDIDDNDNGILDPEDEMDENNPASAPVYEGVTDDKDSHQDDKNKPQTDEAAIFTIVAKNFARLRNV
jgi:hypothetical protein